MQLPLPALSPKVQPDVQILIMKPYERNKCNKAQDILSQLSVLAPLCPPNMAGSPVVRQLQCLNHSPCPVTTLPMSASQILWINHSSPLASLVSERRNLCQHQPIFPDGVLPNLSNPLESLHHHHQPIATRCDLILPIQNHRQAVGQP
jgi:hypothetical protein